MPLPVTYPSSHIFVGFYRAKVAIYTLMTVGLGYYVLIILIGGHHRHNSIQISIHQKKHVELTAMGQPKWILFWTGYFDVKDMDLAFRRSPDQFKKDGCSIYNCWVTANRSQLNRSDALIFHAGDFDPKDLPDHRKPNQRYIFYLFETHPNGRPIFNVFQPNLTDFYFNWTMTHRRDSDVYMAEPYGALKRKGGAAQFLPDVSSTQNEKPRLPSELMIVKTIPSEKFIKRRKMIAWFCSNTNTHGKREDYVRRLNKHVQIDIYGKCGNMTCQPRNSPQCDTLLDNYKFYFSAENSLCPDYVTEKFYRALEADVVPIVYGGADYAKYAPPHSYIHVADFESPKELADYLHFLASNEAMYNKYFDWKKEWQVVKRPLNGWCDLCAKLNDPKSSKETKVYQSISKWWYDDIPCLRGSSFIETLRKSH